MLRVCRKEKHPNNLIADGNAQRSFFKHEAKNPNQSANVFIVTMEVTNHRIVKRSQRWTSANNSSQEELCFNCTAPNHRVSECFSKNSCQHCHKRHHTSICDRNQTGRQTLMTASEINEGILPVVTVRVNGITCRALIDTGAGNSYASAKLLDLIKMKPYTEFIMADGSGKPRY